MTDRKEKWAAYRVAHREELREKAAKYRADNPEKARESNRSSSAKWRAEHPEEAREDRGRAQWAADHPEKRRAYHHRRRAALRGAAVETFLDTEIFERDDYICQLCFEPIDPFLRNHHPRMASLDHIKPISRGGSHTRNNVQAAHLGCNASKGNRS